jgi:hypothetical protein
MVGCADADISFIQGSAVFGISDAQKGFPGVCKEVAQRCRKAPAAVNISSGPQILELQNFSELVDELIQTASEISFALGYNPTLTPIGG